MFKKVPFIIFSVIILTLLSILIQPWTPVYAEESEAECWAVIIGVSDYQRIKGLRYADNDARELSHRLSPIWGEDHIKLLLDSEATKANISKAVDWLASKEDANDTVLFYFAGHGDKGYIAPYDAYYTETWISSRQLKNWLRTLDSEKIVIVLDTCYAGRFETNLSDSGRVVLMSSRSGEVSWWAGALQHGIFGYYILQALKKFDDADANHNYELSAEEIFQYAEAETVSFTTTTEWKHNIQHSVLSDRYSGELSLLMKFIFSTEPSLPRLRPSTILFLDNEVYSSAPVELTWAPGSVHDLRIRSVLNPGGGIRYVFTSWNDGDTSVSRMISDGGEYTANYGTHYQLTIESAYGEPEGEGWYVSGSTATFSVASVQGTTTRHIFTGWSGDYSGDTATASLTMNSPMAITANWRTDYLLTVESAYGEPKGEGWYESGSAATISVASIEGIIIRHVFTGWSGDYTGTTATALLTINSPMAITANWRTDYTQLYMLIAGIIVLVGAIIIIIRMCQRREPV